MASATPAADGCSGRWPRPARSVVLGITILVVSLIRARQRIEGELALRLQAEQGTRELNDAIRTAPARGAGRTTQSDLRDEYQNKCQDDDEAARRRAMEEKRQQRDERRAAINSRQAEQARSAAARDRCNELLRTLSEKRKRLDAMTPGERADHQRFETSYAERCK